MSKTKTTKKAPSTSKPAKAAKKPATKTKKSAQAPTEVEVQTGACPKGGDHQWKKEDDKRFCEKCFEPGDESAAEAAGQKRKSEPNTNGKRSAIDAAAKVLTETGRPMNTKEMITAMAEKGYWTSPGGKTPAATLYSAILREITTQRGEARFQKTERGKFALRGA